jgi:hypothetical protein
MPEISKSKKLLEKCERTVGKISDQSKHFSVLVVVVCRVVRSFFVFGTGTVFRIWFRFGRLQMNRFRPVQVLVQFPAPQSLLNVTDNTTPRSEPMVTKVGLDGPPKPFLSRGPCARVAPSWARPHLATTNRFIGALAPPGRCTPWVG